jgi:hypothetical protein
MARKHASPIVLVALAIALAGCGGSNNAGGSESTTTTAATTTAATTTTATTTAATTTATTTTATTTAATTTAATTTAATTGEAMTTTRPATTTTPSPTAIAITVVDGKPQGGIIRQSVEKGERVVLVVKSDTADEVHLHGYDISRDVTAGGTARLVFAATIPGRFDVELENSGVQLAEITVQ